MADYNFRVDGPALNAAINHQNDGTNKTHLDEHINGAFRLQLPSYTSSQFNPFIPGGEYDIYVSHGSIGSAHRIMVTCKCGKQIPSGRMHQHAPACKQLLLESDQR